MEKLSAIICNRHYARSTYKYNRNTNEVAGPAGGQDGRTELISMVIQKNLALIIRTDKQNPNI